MVRLSVFHCLVCSLDSCDGLTSFMMILGDNKRILRVLKFCSRYNFHFQYIETTGSPYHKYNGLLPVSEIIYRKNNRWLGELSIPT